MTRLASSYNADKRAIHRLQKIQEKYGDGPVLLSVLGRKHALVLSQEDLKRVLDGAPHPFSPASDEKSAALSHFEPHVSLISEPGDRAVRRLVNDQALESTCPNHSLASQFVRVAREEARTLCSTSGTSISWNEFSPAWDRIVRRVVLGDGARDDIELSALLKSLRADGNWSFLWPRNTSKRKAYMARLEQHLAKAEAGSLAAALSHTPKPEGATPCSQATHWIFAFDAGAIATFSTLALLATHGEIRNRAIDDAQAAPTNQPSKAMFPYLRSCLLEALRLWPTTMIVHRQAREETVWNGATMKEGTSLLLFAPYFHRDDRRLTFAHRFSPDIWMDDPGRTILPFIPFSAGPGECPGRHVVLLVGAAMLAEILASATLKLVGGQQLSPERELPGTLDHFSLELEIKTPADLL